jgi:hypothetical protein
VHQSKSPWSGENPVFFSLKILIGNVGWENRSDLFRSDLFRSDLFRSDLFRSGLLRSDLSKCEISQCCVSVVHSSKSPWSGENPVFFSLKILIGNIGWQKRSDLFRSDLFRSDLFRSGLLRSDLFCLPDRFQSL